MNHLIHVAVHYNSLEGTIPDTWWDLGATMTGLNLGYNRLNGTIPGDRLGGMYNLRSLFIDNNHFIGAIPTEVGMLTDLRKCIENHICVHLLRYLGYIYLLHTILFVHRQHALERQLFLGYLANRVWSAQKAERVLVSAFAFDRNDPLRDCRYAIAQRFPSAEHWSGRNYSRSSISAF